jgi:1-phosphatidylinositol-3-phosphate 5-kinase
MSTPFYDKPLPFPPSPHLPEPSAGAQQTLSVDARSHLRTLLRHVLREEEVRDVDEWAREIERVLDVLHKHLLTEGWLFGVRRRKTKRQIEKDKVRNGESDSEGGEKKDDGVSPPELTNAEGSDNIPSSSKNGDSVAQEDTIEARARRQMGVHILDPPSSVPEHHLLLVVAAPSVRHGRPRNDISLDFLQSRIGCSFSLDVFATTQGVLEGTALCGLDNWDGTLFAPTANTS